MNFGWCYQTEESDQSLSSWHAPTINTLTDALFFQLFKGIRYYLNIDRCAYGGVVAVRSLLDGTPQVRGAEILAVKFVNSKCTQVYYNDDGVWKRYGSARNIRCKL